MMEMAVVIVLALATSVVGIWLFCSQKRLMAAETDEEEDKSAEIPDEAAGNERSGHWWEKLMIAPLLVAVEIAVALFMYLFYDDTVIDIVNMAALLAVLWACARIDREQFVIPNRLLLIGLVLRVMLIAVQSILEPSAILYTIVGSAVACGALGLASLLCRLIDPNAIGFGDVKLLMLMGLFLETGRIWGAVLLTMFVGFFYSLYLVVAKHVGRKAEIPFAPLLLIGTVLSAFLTTV